MPSLRADISRFSRTRRSNAEIHISLKQLTTHPSQSHSTDLVFSSEKDVEKGFSDNYGPFTIRDSLTSSNEAKKAAGILPKYVGVTWEDLRVIVTEDMDHKVRTCFIHRTVHNLIFLE
jgi:hypothetical protein